MVTFRRVSIFLSAILCAWLIVLPANSQNIIHTVAGGGTIDPSPALADIPGPTAAVTDAAGDLFVAAPMSQYVFEMNAAKSVGILAGLGFGHYNINGTYNGKANQKPLFYPSGLGVDRQGNVYIADTENNTIRRVDTSGNILTVAGARQGCETQPKCGDGRKAIYAYLLNPQGVTVDAAGNLYIADTGNHVIRYVNAKTGIITLYAGNYVACGDPTSPCGDGGAAKQASLNSPMGISRDSQGNVYIADTLDNRIRMVDKHHVITTVAGTGVPCTPKSNPPSCGDGASAILANIGGPRAVSVSAPGVYYIADTRANRVRVVSAGVINAFAGIPGQAGFSGDGGSPLSATLTAPNGVFVDPAGNVFISDTGNQRIREVTGAGQNAVINTILGGGSGGDAAAANGTYAMLASPYQVAVDASNNYYIADTYNNRIRVVNTQSTPISVAGVQVQPGNIATVAGTGDVGYTGDNGPALSATMKSPFAAAVDSAGNIFIADSYNGWVRRVDSVTGIITSVSATKPVTLPSALAIDQAGDLYIADPPAQVVWKVSGTTISVVAGNGTAGYSGDGGLATSAQLSSPFGVAVDQNNNIFIADSVNNVIRCVLGSAGGCGDATHKYVVGDIVTYAYNGSISFGGDGGLAINASRWLPKEVAVDSRGNLFVGGGQDDLVQRIDVLTGIIATVAGNDKNYNSFGLSGDGKPATIANLDNLGLTVDGNENLLIADMANNRIREVPMVAAVSFTPKSVNFGDQTVGTTSQPQVVTLLNSGADDLSLTSISASGDFAQTNNCPIGSGILAPAQSCSISVTFTPTQKGKRSGSILVTDSGYKSPQSVSLTGTGD
jgi:sugar lactone lactonase YvrE